MSRNGKLSVSCFLSPCVTLSVCISGLYVTHGGKEAVRSKISVCQSVGDVLKTASNQQTSTGRQVPGLHPCVTLFFPSDSLFFCLYQSLGCDTQSPSIPQARQQLSLISSNGLACNGNRGLTNSGQPVEHKEKDKKKAVHRSVTSLAFDY